MAEQAQALIDAAQELEDAPINMDRFQHEPDTGDWRPAPPLPGETPNSDGDWLSYLEATLTDHPVLGRRFTKDTDRVWRYEADNGDQWRTTFDRGEADDSAGAIGLFVWGHPAFPHAAPIADDRHGDK